MIGRCLRAIRSVLSNNRCLSTSLIRHAKKVDNDVISVAKSLSGKLASESNFKLRDYQQKCIESCLEALENDRRRIGVSLPTGAGKTVVFSHLIDPVKPKNGHGNKVMILAHRKELITQAAIKCKETYPEKTVDIEMANYHATDAADVVVASVQTLMRERLEKFNPKDFKMIIVDEAHHAAADSYLKIFDYFGITKPDSDVALVGFSATLKRDDMKNLSDAMDEIVFHMNTQEMIVNKYLSDAKITSVRMTGADLSKVSSKAGDFVASSLSKTVNQRENNELVLRTYLHLVATQKIKSTLVFGVDIAHVQEITSLFQKRGINAQYVTSNTRPDWRNKLVEQFKQGEISVLVNCGIFTEGTDIPNIDCVLLVRPTQSENLLTQMIGRGLRLHKSKDYCHIVDFIGINNSNVVSVPSLQGLPGDDEINGLTYEEIIARRDVLDRRKAANQEKVELDKKRLAAQKEEGLENSLLQGLRKGAPSLGFDEEAFNLQNVELRTYESFFDFMELGADDKESDEYYIKHSLYPWIKVGPNMWIVNYAGINAYTGVHLRLQRHKRGLTKEFLAEVSVSSIYKDKKSLQQNSTAQNKLVYTLSAYRKNSNYRAGPNNRDWKYNKRLIAPVTRDIRKLLTHVDRMFKQNPRIRTATKFQPWRSEKPTSKQERLVFALLNGKLHDLDPRMKRSVIDEIPQMSRGQVSDFLMAHSIFSSQVNYLKRFLLFRAQKKGIYDSDRKVNVTDGLYNELNRDMEEKVEIMDQSDGEGSEKVPKYDAPESYVEDTASGFHEPPKW